MGRDGSPILDFFDMTIAFGAANSGTVDFRGAFTTAGTLTLEAPELALLRPVLTIRLAAVLSMFTLKIDV